MRKTENQAKEYESIGMAIYDLANKISHADENAEIDPIIDDLESVIFDCLEKRDDDSLVHATQISIEKDDIRSFDEIKRAVEYEAVAAEVDGSTSARPVTAHLFAIPVILDTPIRGFSSHLKNKSAFSALEKSIASAGFIDGNPDIHMIRYLYTSDEIESLSPCDVYHFTKIVHKEFNKVSSKKLHQADLSRFESPVIKQSTVPGAARLDANIVLRYLVGVFIDRTSVDPFETAYNAEEGTPEYMAFNATLDQWRAEAVDLVKACVGDSMGAIKLYVGAVDTLYLALQFGEDDYMKELLVLQMYEALSSKRINPRSTRALIVPYGQDGSVSEIRVTLISLLNSEIAAGLVCNIAPLDDYDAIMSGIATILSSHGVFMSNIVGEIQDVTHTNKHIKNNFLITHHDISDVFGIIDDSGPRTLH